MNAHLHRLQAFLAGAGELEVHAPAPTHRPDYFARFARMAGATVIAAHVAAAAAAELPTPAPSAVAAAAQLDRDDRADTEAAINSVKDISARYLAHGRSPLRPVIRMLGPDTDLDEGPAAYVVPGEVCRIDGVRTDYSRTAPRLAKMTGTPEMRALVLVHESMHCRIAPALMGALTKSPSPLVAEYAQIFNESAADAMAVLTVARKDGVPAALAALDQWHSARAAEASSPEADGHHDTRETLTRIRELLLSAPEKLNSDGAAFALSITEALAGAAKAFTASLSPENAARITAPEFRSHMAHFHDAVEAMARDYLEGPHDLGAPEISFHNLTLSAGVPAKPSAWQLFAKRLDSPTFTAKGLREQSEGIADQAFNGASAGVVDAPTIASASAPAPAQAAQPSAAPSAIVGLRSRLGAIYVNAVSAEPAQEPERDQLVEGGPRTGM
jgi:hypothetical protein